jgi:hypothetical protein
LAYGDEALRARRAWTHAIAAVLFAFAGRDQDALRAVARALPAVERAGGGVFAYTSLICRCSEALWRLGRADFADVLERNLLAKTLAGDFRDLGVDARLAMAQLCALTRRPDDAHQWFERARAVLDEQGARPLRALVDLDEAWMEVRRGPDGDRDRARALLDVACEQFQAIGMPGWIERAEALRASVGAATVAVAAPTVSLASTASLRCEGDYWTIAYGDVVARVKDLKGLHYLARLLRSPGQELHVLDLIGAGAEGSSDGPLPLLDDAAKAAYQRRIGDLRAELAEAERCHDLGREEQAREEIEALTRQLAAAMGLGGRDRAASSAAERARSTVRQRLRAVLQRIAVKHPGLADHLTARVRTGTFCAYQPDPERPLVWDLDSGARR